MTTNVKCIDPTLNKNHFLDISSLVVTLETTSKEMNALGVLKRKIVRKMNGT
jgi:hypothetical protein